MGISGEGPQEGMKEVVKGNESRGGRSGGRREPIDGVYILFSFTLTPRLADKKNRSRLFCAVCI